MNRILQQSYNYCIDYACWRKQNSSIEKQVFRVKYLLSGEMAHNDVSLELPPSDSHIKCVKQEPLYKWSYGFPDGGPFARVLTKCVHQ